MTKIALVSGANRGLGNGIARRLGRSDVKVIIGARDAARGERAAAELRREGIDAEWVELDVTSIASVQSAAKEIEERHGRLDILVNNAGILPEAATETDGPLNLHAFKETYETNVFGVVSVIQEFLRLLRESDSARIVNVSSTMGSLADQNDPSSPYYEIVVPAYQSSKVALNGITVALAKLLAGTPIKVNSICPGSVKTDLAPGNREQAPLTPEEGAQIAVEMALIADDGPTGHFVDRNGAVAW